MTLQLNEGRKLLGLLMPYARPRDRIVTRIKAIIIIVEVLIV